MPYTKDDIIPADQWANDHWSTLLYAETVMVDYAGFQVGLDARMRTGRYHFRIFSQECPKPLGRSGAGVAVMPLGTGTLLRDGSVVENHDDWHCIQDMFAAGIFFATDNGVRVEEMEPGIHLHLTKAGRSLVDSLRKHKCEGGNLKDFVYAP